MTDRLSPRFVQLAWFSLVVTTIVISTGALVRATESGAGCGESWPRCDGALIPVSTDAATVIEFTHRMATVASSIAVAWLVIWALRAVGRSHRVGRAALATAGFFAGEVVIGALLVVFGWVDQDSSVGRLIVVPLHLVNTFLLLGAITLVAWWAAGHRAIEWKGAARRPVAVAIGGMLLIGITGAWNALADTLFPPDSVLDAVRQEFGNSAELLVRLRVIHPIVAIAVGLSLVWFARRVRARLDDDARRFSRWIELIVFGQFVIGILNIALLTPVEVQLIHLAVADVLWVLVVLVAASALETSSRPELVEAPS
ncbi:MAG: COX15/CtaA family protein [Acidimicrobiia bacterium]|nr:COX15/CtaA family protein [Acidimicrobiia bacterium]MBT8214338.1 COX15/CtaA family protein [Acidimicrobiia bacterium]NNF69266.1 heme A synthase [Acidimicrobiia bacterium]NNK91561.1 heme A synthase [Acidimicrobiia bacterium]